MWRAAAPERRPAVGYAGGGQEWLFPASQRQCGTVRMPTFGINFMEYAGFSVWVGLLCRIYLSMCSSVLRRGALEALIIPSRGLFISRIRKIGKIVRVMIFQSFPTGKESTGWMFRNGHRRSPTVRGSGLRRT
jgi:hypothetical protein